MKKLSELQLRILQRKEGTVDSILKYYQELMVLLICFKCTQEQYNQAMVDCETYIDWLTELKEQGYG